MYYGREQGTRSLVPRSLFPGKLVDVQAGGAEYFSGWHFAVAGNLLLATHSEESVVFGLIRVGELWWMERTAH